MRLIRHIVVGATLMVLAALAFSWSWRLQFCNGAIAAFSGPLHFWGYFLACAKHGNYAYPPPDEVVNLGVWLSISLAGLVGVIYGFLWSRRQPSTVDRSTSRRRLALRFGLPLILPLMFCLLYSPIDRMVVVNILGCGCRIGEFNDNWMNELIRSAVLFAAIGLLISRGRLITSQWKYGYLCGGAVLMIYISHYFCRMLWL